jgi:hypothetical protein
LLKNALWLSINLTHHETSPHAQIILSIATAALVTCLLPPAVADDQSDMIARLQSSGQLLLDCKAGKAWLDPELWQGIDADAKVNFAHAIFDSCHSAGEARSRTIYDAKSEKQLATYSPRAGLKVD